MNLGLTGKRALVTGGTRGIGRAIAECLAEEGCRVAICARNGEEAEAVAEALPGGYGSGLDVMVPGAVATWVAAAGDALGGVDLLVANVGGALGAAQLTAATREDWVRTFDLNVGHAVEALRACIEPMTAAGRGSAVLISSISGSKPQPHAQYGASKAALDYAASSLGRELGPLLIRVNAVAPGSVLSATGIWGQMQAAEPDRFRGYASSEFPHGRLGTPEEVARVVAFVLSDAASWINGTTLTVDGAQNSPSPDGF